MASQSKGAKKRDDIPNMNNNNPLLVTPKPPSKKDKKEQEQEAMQNYTLSTPPQMISVGSRHRHQPLNSNKHTNFKPFSLISTRDLLGLLLKKSVQLNQY